MHTGSRKLTSMCCSRDVIDAYGQGDSLDIIRYETAVEMAGELDQSVVSCFKSLIELEKKGLIKINEIEPKRS